MSTIEAFPLPQVAFVLGETLQDAKKTVEYNKVDYDIIEYRGRKVRALDFKTLVFLTWAQEHKGEVKPLLRSKLYTNLKEHRAVPRFLRIGDVSVHLDGTVSTVRTRVSALRKLEALVVEHAQGDKFLKGTTIEIYRISALLDGGMSIEEVLRDYPSLSKEQVMTIQTYASVHPKLGRPFPKLTAKAAMDRADFSELDLG